MKRTVTVSIMVAAIVIVTGISCMAGVKKIRPNQMLPARPHQDSFQYPDFISGRTATDWAVFYAIVRLPVGKRITKLSYYHKASSNDNYTSVTLRRAKFGESSEQLARRTVIDSTIDEVIEVDTTAVSSPRVQKGYTYFVTAYSADVDSQVLGIKVYYK